jgi:SAM-dependent methyltransferase
VRRIAEQELVMSTTLPTRGPSRTTTVSDPLTSGSRAGQTARASDQDVRRAYIALHDDFSAWSPSEAFRHVFCEAVVADVRDRLAVRDRVRVLEIGCGHGTWAGELIAALGPDASRVDYTGIDFTEPRIELGRRRLAKHPNVRLQVADANTFEPADPADVIMAIEVVSHVGADTHAAWLARWHRFLRPGGCAVIIDKDRISRHGLRFLLDRVLRRIRPSGRTYYFPQKYDALVRTLRYPSFAALRRIATAAGFTARPLLKHGMFRGLTLVRTA